MPAAKITAIQLRDLSRRQLTEIRRRASTRGMTPEQYIKRLVEEDLAIDEDVKHATLAELAAPLRETFGHLSDADIDAFVDKARGPKTRKR
jgi:hypothetical protein